jgi:hypothetical protein
VGQSGDVFENLIPGQRDTDLFVLCAEVPGKKLRKKAYDAHPDLYMDYLQNELEGGYWGIGDVFILDGVEVWLMYFSIEEMEKYVYEVLAGKHLDSDSGFYPTGRLATLKNIHVLEDKSEVFSFLKALLEVYPESLAHTMMDFHFELALDEEDVSRVLLRKDLLFYHQVLENAIDHFLQTLFALNKTFFPSRKRMEKYLESFLLKPQDCYNRILRVISLGSSLEGVETSCSLWKELVDELRDLIKPSEILS